MGYLAGLGRGARAARGLVGDIEPKPLQLGRINSVADGDVHPEFRCKTTLGGERLQTAFKVSTRFS
jgi:hypothetical protein